MMTKLIAVWAAAAVLCLAVGVRRGRPGKAVLFGLVFGPFALVVVVLDLLEHRRAAAASRAVRPGRNGPADRFHGFR